MISQSKDKSSSAAMALQGSDQGDVTVLQSHLHTEVVKVPSAGKEATQG